MQQEGQKKKGVHKQEMWVVIQLKTGARPERPSAGFGSDAEAKEEAWFTQAAMT